jgi:HEAT repeat protein
MTIKISNKLSIVIISAAALICFTAAAPFFSASAYADSELADAYFYINSKWENERVSALKVFVDKDAEAAVPRIIKLLDDYSDLVRKRAAEAVLRLGHVQDRISVPALIERITIEPKADVLETLLFALASFSEEDNTVMSFREAFKKTGREQKYNIIDAMHPIIKSHKRAFTNFFEILMVSVLSDDDLLRLHAAVAMGEFGDTGYVLKPLLRCVTDSNADVRLTACRYLGIIKPYEALNPLIDRGLTDVSPAVRKEAVEAVANYKRADTFEFFKKIITGDIDAETRAAAALGFIELKDRRAVLPLKAGLLDSANIVRLNCAYALTFFDNYDGEGELVWFLWEQNLPQYRRRAVKGLANINSRTVIDDLQRALKDWDDEVRDTAFHTLGRKWGYRIGR